MLRVVAFAEYIAGHAVSWQCSYVSKQTILMPSTGHAAARHDSLLPASHCVLS